MSSKQYYQQNAQLYFDSTIEVDMQHIYSIFEPYLPEPAYVLDVGCGAGRDALYFKQQGYQVTAIDSCSELCELANMHTDLTVNCMDFNDIAWQNTFDGIWACASLLHSSEQAIVDVMNRLAAALKSKGVLYASFKYGEGERTESQRQFLDMTEDSFSQVLSKVTKLHLIKQWQSQDALADRETVWLNVLLQRR